MYMWKWANERCLGCALCPMYIDVCTLYIPLCHIDRTAHVGLPLQHQAASPWRGTFKALNHSALCLLIGFVLLPPLCLANCKGAHALSLSPAATAASGPPC